MDYQVVKLLGQGTYAQVFLGNDLKTGQQAAIKKKTILELFDHPAIPKVIDFKEGSQKSFLIMQYFYGDTLDVFILKKGCLKAETSRKCFIELMSAISLIHSYKIAHRDIKPQNILINENYDIMLIDFNISK